MQSSLTAKNLTPGSGNSHLLEVQSDFSILSGMSRRSNFTTVTLNSQKGGAKGMKLPGEKSLKENAEKRRTKAQLIEIETHLKRIH